jgi:heterodisulfide reductase subunit B2
MEAKTYTYYPGCSITSTARAYGDSMKAVGHELGMEFAEIADWNCCGATEYFSLNKLPAYSLVARNLSLAAEGPSDDVVAPCSACFLNLRKTDSAMAKYPDLNRKINQALGAGGMSYDAGKLNIRHLLSIVVEDSGYDEIKAHVVRPLTGIKIAPYYGCLIVRPEAGYNTEYPTHLDQLMQTLGADVVDFPMKTHCCGGHMTQISEETAFELIRRLLQNAADYDADMIVTLCPMCQLNLDAYQQEVNRMFGTSFNIPVLYFTQLMGLAFGLKESQLGIGSEIIAAGPALSRIGTETESNGRQRQPRRDKQSLPMPGMTNGRSAR